MLIALVGAYLLGEYRAGFLRFQSAARISRLNSALAASSARNQKLRLKVAFLQREVTLVNQSAAAVKASLSQQQGELTKLRQDLAFYRGIFAPTGQQANVQIGGLQVLPTGRAREYRYQIVLVRADGKSSPTLLGTCRVTVSGDRSGKLIHLPLRSVSPDAEGPLRFTLRYFTNLAGTLDLPTDFSPREINVKVDIKGGSTVKNSFSWPVFRG